ncbi:unnamed protein product [Rotaria magnacalcarata]|uniref:Uncharacterized protein n=1 Tax=Rotaria magnacalcarata TaxID=392030 RepID=A0A816WI76_9BILA|nr:unnamed protein product [Rotaria magnacalcarata]
MQKRIQQQRNNFYSKTTNQPFFEPMVQTATIQSRLLNAKPLGQQPTTPHHYYQKQHQHTSKFNNNPNCSTLNVIGETTLEINISGLKTEVIADVVANLVTDLILGSDWIQRNNVYILTPEQRIMIRSKGKEVSTPLIRPPL